MVVVSPAASLRTSGRALYKKRDRVLRSLSSIDNRLPRTPEALARAEPVLF